MGLLSMLQDDPEKLSALRQGLISAGAAMLQGGRQDFGTSLGQGLGAGVKTYAEKFDEARKKALSMKPYQAAMTPAKPAVPAVYKAGGASLPQLGQAQDVAQNMYNLPQGANPYTPPEQDMTGEALGMPASLMPQGMGVEDFSGGQPGQIEEVAAQPAQAAGFNQAAFEDAILQDPTHPAYQKLVESKVLPGKSEEKTAEQKNFEYMQSLPEDQRQMFRQTRQASAPANVQEWEFYRTLSPPDQARFIEMKRAAQIMNLGGTQAVRATGGGIKESYAVTPKQEDMPSFKAAQATAVDSAKAGVERAVNQPKAQGRVAAADAKTKNLLGAIDQAIKQTGYGSAGLVGQLTAGIGGTPAGNLDATLDSIKANLGFDELQEMRDNSPTGGALGQVAVQEIQYLQSVYSSLKQKQSPDQLRASLKKVAAAKKASNERIKAAYNATYNNGSPNNLPQKPVTHPKFPGFSVVK